MSEPVALVLTGLVLLIAAAFVALVVNASIDFTMIRWLTVVAWVLFTIGLICVIGGIWWEALT